VRTILLAVCVAGALIAGCSQRVPEVRGVLVDVQSLEIVNAESITVRDDQGVLHPFLVGSEVASDREHPNTASHLRQHMAVADPVIVRYRTTAEGQVALQILDARGAQ
jgi:hypothetical protein